MKNLILALSLVIGSTSMAQSVKPCDSSSIQLRENDILADQLTNATSYAEILELARMQQEAGANVCIYKAGVSALIYATWTLPETNNSTRIVTQYRLN